MMKSSNTYPLSKIDVSSILTAKQIPIQIKELLLLADPSEAKIMEYLPHSDLFVLRKENSVGGVLVLKEKQVDTDLEVMNIATSLMLRNQGMGSYLLGFAKDYAKTNRYDKLWIATGNSSTHQLRLYQNLGFQIQNVVHDFFTQNYPDPIYENGVLCEHKVELVIKL